MIVTKINRNRKENSLKNSLQKSNQSNHNKVQTLITQFFSKDSNTHNTKFFRKKPPIRGSVIKDFRDPGYSGTQQSAESTQ